MTSDGWTEFNEAFGAFLQAAGDWIIAKNLLLGALRAGRIRARGYENPKTWMGTRELEVQWWMHPQRLYENGDCLFLSLEDAGKGSLHQLIHGSYNYHGGHDFFARRHSVYLWEADIAKVLADISLSKAQSAAATHDARRTPTNEGNRKPRKGSKGGHPIELNRYSLFAYLGRYVEDEGMPAVKMRLVEIASRWFEAQSPNKEPPSERHLYELVNLFIKEHSPPSD